MAYSDEQRRYVYEIWAMQGGRNAEKTARLVREDPDAVDLGISGLESRTIRNWARDESWEALSYEDIYKAAPHIRFRAQSALALGSPEAAEVLREAVNMNCMVTRGIVLKDQDGNQRIEFVQEFDTKLFQIKVNAAQLLLDRTGFSPVGTRETGQLDPPPSIITEIFDEIREAKTPEALAEAERKLRERHGLGVAQLGIGQSLKSAESRGWS